MTTIKSIKVKGISKEAAASIHTACLSSKGSSPSVRTFSVALPRMLVLMMMMMTMPKRTMATNENVCTLHVVG